MAKKNSPTTKAATACTQQVNTKTAYKQVSKSRSAVTGRYTSKDSGVVAYTQGSRLKDSEVRDAVRSVLKGS